MLFRYLPLLSCMMLFASAVSWAEVPVVVDGKTQTSVTTDNTGHITVQIAPVQTGVTGDISHNSYSNFNVPKTGVSLDNRAVDARTIVNEVTSANPSSIQGALTVLGNQAHVILANPNGITVNGGRFVNTGGVILTTGKISYINQPITPITLQQNVIINTTDGQITIEGEGLSGVLTNLELIARKIKIDGPVANEHLHENARVRLIGGQSNIEVNSSVSVVDQEHDWLRVSPIRLEPAADPILVDITALGSLMSGRVAIAVTDKGAGVRHQGTIATTGKDFAMDTEGNIDLTLGNITSKTHSIIKTSGEISLAGALISAGEVSEDGKAITSIGGIRLDASHIYLKGAPTTLSATASSDFNASETMHVQGGSINALGNITITAGSFINETVQQAGHWQNASITATGGGLLIKTTKGAITNLGGLLQGSSRIADEPGSEGGVSLISATTIDNKSLAKDALAVIFATDDDLSLHAKGRITNNTGQLLSNHKLRITSLEDAFYNITEKESLPDEGIIYEYDEDGGSFFFQGQDVHIWKVAYGEARIPGIAALVSGKGDVEIQASNIRNYGGNILSHEGRIIASTDDFHNEAMVSGHAMTIRKCRWVCGMTGESTYAHTGGVIEAMGDIEITADNIRNIGGNIETLSGHLLLDTPNPIETKSLPMVEVLTMNRGIESAVRGSDYTYLMRYDQGGHLRANMGYIAVPTGTKVIVDGGTVETPDEQISGGIEIVRDPVEKPTLVTGNHGGWLDGILE